MHRSTSGPFFTLETAAFLQKRSDRYTTRHGLPGGEPARIRVTGANIQVWTESGSAVFSDGKWTAAEPGTPAEEAPVIDLSTLPARTRVMSTAQGPDGRVWVVTDRGAFRQEGLRFVPVTPPQSYLTHQKPVNVDARISCVAVDSNGTVWFGSNAGLFATDGADWWNVVDRTAGLPYEEVTCLALGASGELWAGPAEGVCRFTAAGWSYYWGPRWLPGNRVRAIALDGEGAAWVATDGGVARLYDVPVALEQKAEHYQQITEARHDRRGFVTGCRLKVPGNAEAGWVPEASDNDGLWTALYVAAQSFRYGATGDPAARAAARKSMEAMLDLVRYTGIPGFPARAIIRRNEEVDGYDPEETVRFPGEPDRIWFQSPVDPEVLCKGDTSSDELDGHYFAWSIYSELVADEEEGARIRATVEAVTDHLLSNDLTLVGPTGRRTRWGVYHPSYLNDDPVWWEERGLNALSILSYLKIAEHLCGHARYREKYRELIESHHYLLNTVTQKVAEPWWKVNHSDDEMAFMMYYTLLRLERDPATRLVLLQSLERSWRIERPERSPFFNFIYGACTGCPCDVEASVATLQEWPWELIDWEARGSHRHDVEVLTRNGISRSRKQLTHALPAAERRLMRWNGNPYQCDGGTPDGRLEEDGSAWLLPYWMGRYHGFVR